MEITTSEQAHEALNDAVARAIERHVTAVGGGQDPVRFADVLAHPLPTMVSRVLRSVEESFWRREADRRQRDPRFVYSDPLLREIQEKWDAALRATMVLTAKELRQLVGRALSLQMDAIVSPVETIKTNYFARQDKLSAKNSIIIANHLGLDERYVRALTFMAQDDDERMLTAEDFRRLLRDVDIKEFSGSKDLVALAALSQALAVLGLRTEDELGAAPTDVAVAFMVLLGTPEGADSVRKAADGARSMELADLHDLFAPDQPAEELAPAQSSEEVKRFLADLGVDAEAADIESVTGAIGAVRFVLTDEEKQAYVARAVGRNVHLIEPIMKSIEGALTWDEVDRVVNEMIPDSIRDEDSSARSFRSRIRDRDGL